MSPALEVIFATYPRELDLRQVSSLLNGSELEALDLLENGDLSGRQFDGQWFVLKEHVKSFILSCKSPLKVIEPVSIENEVGFTTP